MPASDRIRPADVRRCARLVDECRDAGADHQAWQTRLLTGLFSLLDAQVGISGNMRDFGPGRPNQHLGSIRLGWPDQRAERAWLDYVESVPVERTPEFPSLARTTGAIVTRLRDQLWDRTSWYRSRAFNEIHRRSGIDDYVISLQRLPVGGLCHSLWIHRPVGAPPFGRRHWWMLRYVHERVGRLVGGPLASAVEPSVSDLTPRRRQILDGLLDGDSEKQIAYRLDLSRPTVHEHVMAVYRHFGVSSRGELMAWFVGRTRPPHPET
ncbi:MAG: LuxR family transcriptional regulator [Leptolyngbya sp. PLA2]|nr:LuxR family transcriptional regulator [Leptolyngbya sp.]MCE7972340.1 LuxR family transcriptional regulator [Leptolyngbya sp. PL-A2]MCZ7632478.1 helix-turn-helix transcriptional regulator [Phycisphaerales bacterium]MDL1905065.1 helix-turn-helix transcriptional regulator [Synechococcales cyanobacterium CNB]GIK19966.1 MAG: hypothetical protein BroJett004_21300 [Planctomycetota bacterium]